MRTILFKAQRTQTKEWCYGYLHQDKSGRMRIKAWDYDYEINPDTLCEYTGVHDVYDTMIFENDIVTVSGKEHKFTVVFYNGQFALRPTHSDDSMLYFDSTLEVAIVKC